ncbi:MAG: amidohydrolase family protein, partial [bacterium]
YIEKALRLAGPRKLLFGSDGPWLHPGAELCKLRPLFDEMRLPESAIRAILGGNVSRLLGLSGVRKRNFSSSSTLQHENSRKVVYI